MLHISKTVIKTRVASATNDDNLNRICVLLNFLRVFGIEWKRFSSFFHFSFESFQFHVTLGEKETNEKEKKGVLMIFYDRKRKSQLYSQHGTNKSMKALPTFPSSFWRPFNDQSMQNVYNFRVYDCTIIAHLRILWNFPRRMLALKMTSRFLRCLDAFSSSMNSFAY